AHRHSARRRADDQSHRRGGRPAESPRPAHPPEPDLSARRPSVAHQPAGRVAPRGEASKMNAARSAGADVPLGQPDPGPGPLPPVVADPPLDATIEGLLRDRVEILPWTVAEVGSDGPVEGMYTYGHVLVDGAMLDRLPGLKVISNYGVGVDHINLEDAA